MVLQWSISMCIHNYFCTHTRGDDKVWAELMTSWSVPPSICRIFYIPVVFLLGILNLNGLRWQKLWWCRKKNLVSNRACFLSMVFSVIRRMLYGFPKMHWTFKCGFVSLHIPVPQVTVEYSLPSSLSDFYSSGKSNSSTWKRSSPLVFIEFLKQVVIYNLYISVSRCMGISSMRYCRSISSKWDPAPDVWSIF